MPGWLSAVIWSAVVAGTFCFSTTYCLDVGFSSLARISSLVIPSGPASALATEAQRLLGLR